MFASLRNRVVHFKIHGNIDSKMTEKVNRAIKASRFYLPQLVAVSVFSTGGQLVQAKTIAQTLHNYASKTEAPVYCFADDMNYNSALALLCAGNKVFANKFSIFGDFGYSTQKFGKKEFAKKWNYEFKYLYQGENKVKLNSYEDLKEQDVKWQIILSNAIRKEFQLRKYILENRHDRMKELGISQEQLDSDLWGKYTINGQKALDLGLVDDICTLQDLVEERYHGMKIVDIMQVSEGDRFVTKAQGPFELQTI